MTTERRMTCTAIALSTLMILMTCVDRKCPKCPECPGDFSGFIGTLVELDELEAAKEQEVELKEEIEFDFSFSDLIDHIEVLEKTIEVCCGTEFRDADLEAFMEALGEVRRQLEDLEVRLLILEGPDNG